MIPNKLDRQSYTSVFLVNPSRPERVIEQDESELDTYELYQPEGDILDPVVSEGGVHELVVSEEDKLDKSKQSMDQDESDEDESDEDESDEDEMDTLVKNESDEDKSDEDESDEDEMDTLVQNESDEDESDEDEMDTLVQGKSRLSIFQLDITELDISQLEIHDIDRAFHTEKDKVTLRLIVHKFVTKAKHQAKESYSMPVIQSIIERLWESIWAEVKHQHFVITPDTHRHLHRDVYQALCQMWSCEDQLMMLLSLQEPSLDTFVVATFRQYLTLPRDHSFMGTVRKFFSSVSTTQRTSTWRMS
ncbi:unnamed protein product [Pleuronectes platessa]|uniref:Uncharacterized protein n=1 Tax=Pleuronectes platessa TaxID=8262 RepID=A0A9N7UVY8_PLEPL|nr:unnamed protein product [Pleuronectes platessa]